jgi:predicted aspartyl protease
MVNVHPYDRVNFNPPAPALVVGVQNAFTGEQLTTNVLALIDSGADGSQIPEEIADSLGLQPVTRIEVVDFAGNSHGMRAVYDVRIIIDSIPFSVQAAETEGDFLIGRDLINTIRLVLDGPKLEFTL